MTDKKPKGKSSLASIKDLRAAIKQNIAFTTAVSEAAEHYFNEFSAAQRNTADMVVRHWGAASGLIRLLEKLGIRQGWWADREEFQQLLVDAVKEVVLEGAEQQKRELARIRDEQARGVTPTPMTLVQSAAEAAAAVLVKQGDSDEVTH